MKFSPSNQKRLEHFLSWNRYTDKNFKYHAGMKQSPFMEAFSDKHILSGTFDEPSYKLYLINDVMFNAMLNSKIKRK